MNHIHYDFIEIGTSDFHTLIESATDKTIGLSIEPIKTYLDRLPNKENVLKVQAAVSDSDSTIEIYHIPLEKIRENGLQVWVKGCNSVSKPHNYARNKIGHELYDSLVEIDTVPTITWKTLIEKYNIGGVKFIKIDTEGHDHIILKGYLDECKKNPLLYANRIKFEYNDSSDKSALDELIKDLDIYDIEILDEDIILTKKTGLYYKEIKIADAGYVINLPNRADRKEKVIQTLSDLNITGYEFIDGIVMDNPEFKKLGCTQTYLNIFKDVLTYGFDNIIVFEDDIKLMNGVSESDLDAIFNNWSDTIKDYDVVALGVKLLPRSKISKNSDTHGSFKEMLCSQTLFYHKHFIKHYVSQMKDYLDPSHYLYKCTIDMFLNDCTNDRYRFIHSLNHKSFNFGITIPMVFTQTSSYSDNELSPQNYDKIMEDAFWKSILHEKAYVLYANEQYFDIVKTAVKSIREFSKYPIFVYLLDSDLKIDIDGVTTINWKMNLGSSDSSMYHTSNDNFYINRSNKKIYNLLIQRPMIVKDALQNYASTVCYVDSDSISTPFINNIFELYNNNLNYPYFVEGIYDYLHLNGRGGAETREDMSTTLEHPACELFGVNQYVRLRYRQTGYFVAGKKSIDFLDEWYWMCNHPKVLNNHDFYAPYHEETIMNVLLWKYNIMDGLPYIYVNGGLDTVDLLYHNTEFKGPNVRNHLGNWLRAPETKEHILFFHGEKRIEKMEEMIEKIKGHFEYAIDPAKNWGDIISHKIVEHFSGKKLNPSKIFHFDPNATVPFVDGKLMVSGSILMYSLPEDYIWGSGCIKEREVGVPPKKYYAVRGPLTRGELIKVGRECPEVYGDPALLFPKIYNPDIKKKYKFGIIPHFIDYRDSESLKCLKKLKEMGFKIINVTAGLFEFIDELKEVEHVISSSLHGLIAADAYGIPNARVYFSDGINGGDFKYIDYYASVKRNYETPQRLISENIEKLINELKFEIGDISIKDKLLESSPWNDPSCTLFKRNDKMKLLFLAPHLSTGGMPSFLLKRIETLQMYCPEIELFVVEYGNYGDAYVVQRNKIKSIIPSDHFWTLGQNKMELIDIIKNNNIDIIHVDEMLEGFDTFNQVSIEVLNALYDSSRSWKMIETCHNVWFKPEEMKKFNPDAYAFCTPYHKIDTFSNVPSYGEVLEFPIDNRFRTKEEQLISQKELGFDTNKIHVINIGLWTTGKNQKEGVDIARLLVESNPEIQFHFIGNQAPNFKEYWEPIMNNLPSNVKVWGERSDIDTFMKATDIFMFNSTWECNPLALREAISYGLKILSRNLPQYLDMFTPYINNINDNIISTKEKLLSLINEDRNYNIIDGKSKQFAIDHLLLYNKVNNQEITSQQPIKSNIQVIQYFINKPFLEIKGNTNSSYNIKMFDEKDVCQYENTLPINHWIKLNKEYYTKWTTKIWEDNNLIYENTLNYKGKRVFISFDSKSLGDTVSWIPYVLEFKKKHECEVTVSTYWNKLFKKVYPEIVFVEPGSTVNNIYGMYNIGWFYDKDKEPELPNTIPLQKTITNILGLDYTEIQPKINHKIGPKPYSGKYITIATNSTSGCKFWTREGWQELINHLHSLGYKIINVSKENNPFDNVSKIHDTSIDNTMNVIYHSEFFIGLSSGLSWLAWGLGKHVVMISNFTEPDHEFTTNCTRIVNLSVCNGCWNNPIFKFDKGDWDWCPVHKGTERQFECHKSITPTMVINQIKHLL